MEREKIEKLVAEWRRRAKLTQSTDALQAHTIKQVTERHADELAQLLSELDGGSNIGAKELLWRLATWELVDGSGDAWYWRKHFLPEIKRLLEAPTKWECTCKGRFKKPAIWHADDDCPIHGLKSSAASAASANEPTNWKGVRWKDSVKASSLAEEIALHFAHVCEDSMCGEDADESNCEFAWVESKLQDFLDTLAAAPPTAGEEK